MLTLHKLAVMVCIMGGVTLMTSSLRGHWGLRQGISPLRSGVGLLSSVVLMIVGVVMAAKLPHLVAEWNALARDLPNWWTEGKYLPLAFFVGIPVSFVLLLGVMVWQGVSNLRKWRVGTEL